MNYRELLEKYNLLLSEIGIFAGLPESMAGWVVRQAKDALFQMR
jgi:hypothetical protein